MSSKSNERSLIFEISKIKTKKYGHRKKTTPYLNTQSYIKRDIGKKYQNIFELKLLSNA